MEAGGSPHPVNEQPSPVTDGFILFVGETLSRNRLSTSMGNLQGEWTPLHYDFFCFVK